MTAAAKGNLDYWVRLQDDEGYFDKHPIYNGLREFSLNDYGGDDALQALSAFGALGAGKKVAVIGCGYGRETLQIAPRVAHVWGIDVSEKLLARTRGFLSARGVDNFTPVLASEYDERLPRDLDVVFSVVVMQHLTRSLVLDYFTRLREHLVDGGVFVVQFLEELYDGVDQRDAELRVYEPSISWTLAQLAQLSLDTGLRFEEVRTQMLGPKTLWHWVHFSRQSAAAAEAPAS
jgi:cyclopropane fatty-acyl-phospholipid synthase-like methyltransferase